MILSLSERELCTILAVFSEYIELNGQEQFGKVFHPLFAYLREKKKLAAQERRASERRKKMKINSELAWSVTQHFLIAVGGMALVDFIVTTHTYFVVVAVGGSSLTWAVLYKLEKGIREKWQKSFEQSTFTERTGRSNLPNVTFQPFGENIRTPKPFISRREETY